MPRTMKPGRTAAAVLLAARAACQPKGTLDRSQVEYVTVEGRRLELRMAPTDAKGEYRVLTAHMTIVVGPHPEVERNRVTAHNLAGARASRPASCLSESGILMEVGRQRKPWRTTLAFEGLGRILRP
ncbi:MAG: hypothetical protein GEV13_08115 [Rhodospirillales bacterium]|nr:hypothetical protein [Rhodospirillales bacterium]